MTSKLNKLEDFYKWLSNPNPVLVDITTGTLAIILTMSLITLVGWLVCKLFGWYLIPILLVALLIVSGVHLIFAHKNCDGGIKGWWEDKPW